MLKFIMWLAFLMHQKSNRRATGLPQKWTSRKSSYHAAQIINFFINLCLIWTIFSPGDLYYFSLHLKLSKQFPSLFSS